MKAELKYPILIFDPGDDMVWGFGCEEDFQTTTTRILTRHNRAGVVVVDSTGTKYTIRRAYQTGWRGLHGWTGMNTGVISLENEYEDNPVKISPDELRDMMTERYLKHQEEEWFIEEWENEQTFRTEMAEYRTIEALIGSIVSVPKLSLWERLQDYFFRLLFIILALMLLWIIWLFLQKTGRWIIG